MRKYRLVYYLYYHQGSQVSVATLSELFQVSKKTISADFSEIEKKNYVSADKIPITLKIIKGKVVFNFSNKASILEIRQHFFEESITFKLLTAFYKEGSFKLLDFSSSYYYSLSVVYKKINELKINLRPYGLSIQSEYGSIFLTGDEEKKRIFYGRLYYYVYGDRTSFLDPEKKIAKSYFKQIKVKHLWNNTLFQKRKKIKLSILIAVSLQRMNNFPLIEKKRTYLFSDLLMDHNGQKLLKENYPGCSKNQLNLERQWMTSFIISELKPYLSIKENSLFNEGLIRISNIFKFHLTSRKGKLFKQMMLMYYKEKKNCKKSSTLPVLSFANGPSVDISSNLYLEVLIKENHKREFEYSIYPLSLEECANILKISGIGTEKIKVTFISEYPPEWGMFLYRKILTLELKQFYEWSDDVLKADIVIADNNYPSINKKNIFLISPLPSDKEIKKLQNNLINHLNQVSKD
ncbi:helix-turn-helix domain-containing protein [Carnobacterium maltaromaticum]|nr:helix-turn-helix domain-containing protein [Carnobacterium maltaromaticum]